MSIRIGHCPLGPDQRFLVFAVFHGAGGQGPLPSHRRRGSFGASF